MTCRLRQQKRIEPFEYRILVSSESGNHFHWSNVEPLDNLARRPFLCAIDSTTGRPATKSIRGIVWPLSACLKFGPDSWNSTAYAAFDSPFWVALPLECVLVPGSWTRLRGTRWFPSIASFHYIPCNNELRISPGWFESDENLMTQSCWYNCRSGLIKEASPRQSKLDLSRTK